MEGANGIDDAVCIHVPSVNEELLFSSKNWKTSALSLMYVFDVLSFVWDYRGDPRGISAGKG